MSAIPAPEDVTPSGKTRAVKPTFVSPVTRNVEVNRGHRVTSYRLYLMQAGSPPITLEYSSQEEARTARIQLAKTASAHGVNSARLFQAIVQSLTS